MELPECPVCLQVYDGACTVPRVLACGHTSCESCLVSLPQQYPDTVRCPACTQLVKYPPQGPSGLPKNIDLLRFSSENPNFNLNSPASISPKQLTHDHHPFVHQFWSVELHAAWGDWVLPQDSFSVEPRSEEERDIDDQGLCSVFRGRANFSSMTKQCYIGESQKVSLVRVASLPAVKDSVLEYSYTVQIMKCLSGMKEKDRNELDLILKASMKLYRMCKVYGLWGNSGDGFLYLVSERHCGSLMIKMHDFRNGFISRNGNSLDKGALPSFSMIAMEMCEAVIALHLEGLALGCVNLSCFSMDEYGHVLLDFIEVMALGRKVRRSVARAASERRIGDREMEVLVMKSSTSDLLASPELICELLQREGIGLDGTWNRDRVERRSDVWPLACMLLWLLVGDQFSEDLVDCMRDILLKSNEENYVDQNMGWVEKISSLLETRLGEDCLPLQQVLCKCINFDPGSRPPLFDVWYCIRELIIRPQFDILFRLDGNVSKDDKIHFLVLGELCQLPEKITGTHKQEEKEYDIGGELDHFCEERIDKNIVDGVSQGTVKFKNMEGHLDCITGLALGGGFLFSSSFDKTIQVWSLQDFSHVHTFRGHEHKVMAIVYIDEELPLCISGDSGGGIFLWGISSSLGQEPLQKWYEEKDWRYSGIHALAVPGNKHLYTGSGDKSIKAWSLLDRTLTCTMNGHKSVVSALAACNGVLYSGSYDGTIRLWCLSDHSPLTVLGNDVTGNITSVLSLKAYGDTLVATHENGCVKIWRSDVLMKSVQMHDGATFAVGMEGKWLFTGGWDKTIKLQELSVDSFQMDVTTVGSIACASVITSLVCWQGKLFAGYANRDIKIISQAFQNRTLNGVSVVARKLDSVSSFIANGP